MQTIRRRRLLVAAAAAILAGCTVAETPPIRTGGRPDSPLAANRASGIWPELVMKAPLNVRQAYEYAASPQQVLQFMPCFCGCGAIGHEDNLSCFVERFAGGGWVVLEPHAMACSTCVGVALDAMALDRQGLGVKEIRRAIDEKWSKVGPATPTRLP